MSRHEPTAGALEKVTSEGGEVWWYFWCPGCSTHHGYRTQRGEVQSGPTWEFNGDEARPTFTPSLLCNGNAKPEDLHPHTTSHRCHIYVTDGQVRYLGDCTHKLAGQTLPLERARFGS